MSERLNKCPKCGALQYQDRAIKIHDPDTTNINSRATLSCDSPDCDHEWEGWITSVYHRRQQEIGWVL